MVMVQIKGERKRVAACILRVALIALALAGCYTAVGNLMNWQQVDTARALSGDAGNQKWNTYRFQTVGPFEEQRIAYVLFSDDVTMNMRRTPYVDLGKMTLREVQEDHAALLRQRMWIGTALVFREFRRGGNVIACTANEFQMDVDLWEISAEGPKVEIRLNFIDRRSRSGSGGSLSNPSAR
jgi:hypothetical protein